MSLSSAILVQNAAQKNFAGLGAANAAQKNAGGHMANGKQDTQDAHSGPDRKYVFAQLAELSKSRASGSISDEEYRVLRIQAIKAGAIAPVVTAEDHLQETMQSRPYLARAIDLTMYTLLLNHVPGMIVLLFLINLFSKVGSSDTLGGILKSNIFQ
jgi:hypothetical protein